MHYLHQHVVICLVLCLGAHAEQAHTQPGLQSTEPSTASGNGSGEQYLPTNNISTNASPPPPDIYRGPLLDAIEFNSFVDSPDVFKSLFETDTTLVAQGVCLIFTATSVPMVGRFDIPSRFDDNPCGNHFKGLCTSSHRGSTLEKCADATLRMGEMYLLQPPVTGTFQYVDKEKILQSKWFDGQITAQVVTLGGEDQANGAPWGSCSAKWTCPNGPPDTDSQLMLGKAKVDTLQCWLTYNGHECSVPTPEPTQSGTKILVWVEPESWHVLTGMAIVIALLFGLFWVVWFGNVLAPCYGYKHVLDAITDNLVALLPPPMYHTEVIAVSGQPVAVEMWFQRRLTADLKEHTRRMALPVIFALFQSFQLFLYALLFERSEVPSLAYCHNSNQLFKLGTCWTMMTPSTGRAVTAGGVAWSSFQLLLLCACYAHQFIQYCRHSASCFLQCAPWLLVILSCIVFVAAFFDMVLSRSTLDGLQRVIGTMFLAVVVWSSMPRPPRPPHPE